MLVISLMLHGLVLWLPLPEDQPKQVRSRKQQAPVKVVRLPKGQVPKSRAIKTLLPISVNRSLPVQRPRIQRPNAAAVVLSKSSATVATPKPLSSPTVAPSLALVSANQDLSRSMNRSPVSSATLVLDDLVIMLNQYLPAEPSDFTNPELFYEQISDAEIGEHRYTAGGFRLATDADSRSLLNVLHAELHSKNFQLAAVGGYAGGQLYEVTQGKFKHYLSLVPNKEGTGTLIVLWSKQPPNSL